MSTKYFINVKTIEELKTQYKKLAFQHHPDKGGNEETMKIINAEYEILTKALETEKESAAEILKYKEVIETLINVPNIIIEAVGTWIWVSGDTKQCKDILKELNFKWNRKRELWQRKPDEEKNRKSRAAGKTTEELKNYWGSKIIKGDGPFKPSLT